MRAETKADIIGYVRILIVLNTATATATATATEN
jgi:hypothetical protein